MYVYRPFGNTEICVEDLYHTLGLLPNGKYPGVCQHCGKTGIRYIAHVKQDVADTLARALGNETHNGGTLERSEEDQNDLSAALLEGKEFKQIDVGCVCVAKYFLDCGVDAGMAQRAQDEVSKIMSLLQQMAALDADRDPARVAEVEKNWHLVCALRARVNAVTAVKYWTEPALQDPTAQNEYMKLRFKVKDEYEKAAERWKREAHGFRSYFIETRPFLPENLLAYYDSKIMTLKHKLAIYQRGVQYTNA